MTRSVDGGHSEQRIVVGLGEVLWDLLPGGKQLGGAPANFAYITTLLGDQGIVASRIGSDARGQEVLHRLKQLGLPTLWVQLDDAHPTGVVQVDVDEKGQPRYTIIEDVAWDFLEWTPQWERLAAQSDAVCFGSLAQRAPLSRDTIYRFLHAMRHDALRIFDVNLRQSFYSAGVLSESLKLAKVVKLNDVEVPLVVEMLKLGGRGEKAYAHRLIQVYDLELVCITRGAHGSLLVTEEDVDEHPGFQIEVADTVGAGDAFTAALAYHYLRGASLGEINEAANRLGSWVASQVGATPPVEQSILRQVIKNERS